jgi:hypothetical protein
VSWIVEAWADEMELGKVLRGRLGILLVPRGTLCGVEERVGALCVMVIGVVEDRLGSRYYMIELVDWR